MSKLIYVPLENLPQRYTVMMNNAINKHADIILYPDIEIDTQIKNGEFLDIINTSKFKAIQLQMISELFNENKIEDGDTFLIADIFFPGIESIKYMSELLDIDVKVYGFNHAGRSDANDFVQKLGEWSDASEKGYNQLCDGIFVGSEHHKNNIKSYFNIPDEKLHTTGVIWDLTYMDRFKDEIGSVEKEDFIIWPHRICEEKGINDLIEFAKSTNKKIVITSSGPERELPDVPDNIEYIYNLSKLEYYTLMAKAKWYLSNAYQETFGYTIQEAIYFNCNILVPNRACCPEMVPEKCVYNDLTEIEDKLNQDLVIDFEWTNRFNDNILNILAIIRGDNENSV